jgi:capsular exopolysaccharide synthesis family protein
MIQSLFRGQHRQATEIKTPPPAVPALAERIESPTGLERIPLEEINVDPASRIVFYTDPRGLAADRFRFLRLRIRERSDATKLKSILVTSALPQDGKSTVSLNLATALAKREEDAVLLLEADLYHPTLAQRLGLKAGPGLAECLASGLAPLSVIRRIAPLGWYFLPAGSQLANPSQLLHGDEFAKIMRALSPHFKWIVIDSPPVGPIADAVAFARHADASLLVVRAGRTPSDAVEAALKSLGTNHVIGIVLNGVEGLERLYSKYNSYYGSPKPNENKGAGKPHRPRLAARAAALIIPAAITGASLGYRWVQRLASPRALAVRVGVLLRRPAGLLQKTSQVSPWLAASMAALILAVAITSGILGRRRASPPTLGLQVRRGAGQFQVNWDRNAPEILRARHGVLTVRDGSYEAHLDLDAPQLRSGSLAYTSAGADLRFQLDVFRDGDRKLSESIRIVTPTDTVRPETGKMLAQAGVNTGGKLESGPHAAGPGKSEARAATAAVPIGNPEVVRRNSPLMVTPKDTVRPETGRTLAQAGAKTGGKLESGPHAAGPGKSEARAATAAVPTGNPAVAQRNSPVGPKIPAGPARTYRAQTMERPPARAASYLGPQVIQQVEPLIPAESRASLASEVQIDVRVGIDAEGIVTHAEVTSASGARDPSLASAAMRAARQFRFQPARLGDRSVPSGMILSFRFVR